MTESILGPYLERKEQLQELRESNPEEYLKSISDNLSKTLSMLSRFFRDDPVIERLDTITKTIKDQDLKISLQQETSEDSQVKITNSIDNLNTTIQKTSKEIVKALKDLKPKKVREKAALQRRPSPRAVNAVQQEMANVDDDTEDFEIDVDSRGRERRRGRPRIRRRRTRPTPSRPTGIWSRITSTLSNLGSRAGQVIGGIGPRIGGVLTRSALPAAAVVGGLSVYNTLKDEQPTAEQKTDTVARTLGSLAGAQAGAMAGGSLGAFTGPAAPIATPLGAALGGAAGFIGGEKAVDAITTTLKQGIAVHPEIGDIIGRAIALSMSPVNREAREALKADFQYNILPALNKVFTPVTKAATELKNKFEEYTDIFKEGGTALISSVGRAGSTVLESIKSAGRAIQEGYKYEGVTGAFQSLRRAGSELEKGLATSVEQIGSGFTTARDIIKKDFRFTPIVERAIEEASAKTNVDPAFMRSMAYIESRGRTDAKNASGAAGLYQFMPTTARRYDIRGKEFDPTASALAAAQLAKDNAAKLRKRGIEPTPQMLYLAHQQGDGGAAQLVKAAQQGLTWEQLPAKLRRNMASNAGAGMSAKEFIDFWSKDYDKKAAIANYNYMQPKDTALSAVSTPVSTDTRSAPKVDVATGITSDVSVQQPSVRMAPESQISVKPAPVTLVSPNLPPEPQKVFVENQQQPLVMKDASNTQPQQPVASSQPNIDEIPLVINDLGLVLLNIGHL